MRKGEKRNSGGMSGIYYMYLRKERYTRGRSDMLEEAIICLTKERYA
jgi:hypothetical protein